MAETAPDDIAGLVAWAQDDDATNYLWCYITRERRQAIGLALAAQQAEIERQISFVETLRERLRTELAARDETIRGLEAEIAKLEEWLDDWNEAAMGDDI